MENVKTSFVCPCCSGPIVYEMDAEPVGNGKESDGGERKINAGIGYNGHINGGGGRYACAFCKTSIPKEHLVEVPSPRLITRPSFICANHGGCHNCHRAFAVLHIKYWLSQAFRIERVNKKDAKLCKACIHALAESCEVDETEPITETRELYNYLVTRRDTVERERVRGIVAAWVTQKSSEIKASGKNGSTDVKKIHPGYPDAIHLDRCYKCGNPGYLVMDYRSCGRPNCKCAHGTLHGPYFSIRHQPHRNGPQSVCHLNHTMLARMEREITA